MDREREGEERRRRRKGQLNITVGVESEREEKRRDRDLERDREGSREKIGLVVKDKGMEGRLTRVKRMMDRSVGQGGNGEKKCQSIDQYGQRGGEEKSEVGEMGYA